MRGLVASEMTLSAREFLGGVVGGVGVWVGRRLWKGGGDGGVPPGCGSESVVGKWAPWAAK